MKPLTERYQADLLGVLSCYDRTTEQERKELDALTKRGKINKYRRF